MGGYGSGRRKTHRTTYECIAIDTTQLLKQKLLTGEKRENGITMTFSLSTKDMPFVSEYSRMCKERDTQSKHSLHVLVKRYDEGNPGNTFARWDAVGQVTMGYCYRIGDEGKGKQVVELPLVVTHPNYGGVRYWLLAPCCGQRVRIVYLPTFGGSVCVLPQCRKCLDLNYASQQASYIERHITREKHLLANYGYCWAAHEYQCMKEHYFQITPEYREKKARSELERHLHLIKMLMSFNRLMLHTHIREFRTLICMEDRCIYLEQVLSEWGTGHTLNMLIASRGHRYALPGEIDGLVKIISEQPAKETHDYTMDDQKLSLIKVQIEDELEWLDKAA
jgi:hypothetical protein